MYLCKDAGDVFCFLKDLLQKQVDLWDKLAIQIKEEAEISLKELEQGIGISHSDVMQKYDK